MEKTISRMDKGILQNIEAEPQRKNVLTSSESYAQKTAPKGTLVALGLPHPVIVSANTTVRQATQLCIASRSNSFLVINDGVIGIVTSDDVVNRVIAEGREPSKTPVHQIMTRNPVIIDGSCTATQALEQMLIKKFRHLPIRGEDRNIFGILDISKIFYDALATAHRRSSAYEKLFNAMAGIEAELGTDGSQSDAFSWAAKLHERTALPDLARVMGSTTQPVAVNSKASVYEVAQLMRERGMSAVCVTEDATLTSPRTARRIPRIIGIFTSKDILFRVIAPELDPLQCSVASVMTPQPDTAHPTMTVYDTVKKMCDGHFLHMPVVENDGRLVAVVDIYSLAAATYDQIIATNQELSVPVAAKAQLSSLLYPTEEGYYDQSPLRKPCDETRLNSSLTFQASEVLSIPPTLGVPITPTSVLPSVATAPVVDNTTFVFKIFLPRGMTYRITTRHYDYKQIRDSITEKILADTHFGACPDAKDYRLSYKDEDGDRVVITTDHDVADAVQVSQNAKKACIVLWLEGGATWEPTVASDKRKPVATPQYVPSFGIGKSDVAQILLEPNTCSDCGAEPSLPGYTANDKQNSPYIGVSATGPLKEYTNLPLMNKIPMSQHAILPQVNNTRRINVDPCLAGVQRSDPAQLKDAVQEAFVARFGSVLDDPDLYGQLLKCSSADARKIFDHTCTVLDTDSLSPRPHRHFLVAIQRLSKSANLHTACHDLKGVEMISQHPIAAGGFADIYRGRYSGQDICLKLPRIYEQSDQQSLLNNLSKEAIVGRQRSHPNILPIYGLFRFKERLCIITPWMPYGNVNGFLRDHPHENRDLLVLDVGLGLAHLHTHDTIHGDIKGPNILIDGNKRARIADYGLASVNSPSIPALKSLTPLGSCGGTVPWQAPELFGSGTDEDVQNTKYSDVYAFSCVAYEIFTGNKPFFECPRDATIISRVSSGGTPSRPPPSSPAWGPWGLTEARWSLMQACWDPNPEQRPNIHDVVSQLKSTILVDDQRPLESNDTILSPGAFHDLVRGEALLSSVEEIMGILNRQISGFE